MNALPVAECCEHGRAIPDDCVRAPDCDDCNEQAGADMAEESVGH